MKTSNDWKASARCAAAMLALCCGTAAAGPLATIDASSFPVVITNPGAYQLTGDIIAPNTATNAISVQADRVSIDLGGFTLKGAGAGSGIIQGEAYSGLTVSNGVLDGWTAPDRSGHGANIEGKKAGIYSVTATACDTGIRVGPFATVADCTVYSNKASGLILAHGSVASRCTAYANATGIDAAADCELHFCTCYDNAGDGIRAKADADLATCTANNNRTGMDLGANVSVDDSSANDNRECGITVADQCTLRAVSANGNGSAGIRAGSSSKIQACTVHANGKAGIEVTGASNEVVNSRSTKNETGFLVTGSGNTIAGNGAGSNKLKNYEIAPGNNAAPVMNQEQALAASNTAANVEMVSPGP